MLVTGHHCHSVGIFYRYAQRSLQDDTQFNQLSTVQLSSYPFSQEVFMTNPFLIGDKIYLRAPEPGDEEIYSLSQNHPDPRENLFYALPSSVAIHRENIK